MLRGRATLRYLRLSVRWFVLACEWHSKRVCGGCEVGQLFDIFAFLSDVAPVEATEYTGEILGARATWAVREMALCVQEVNVEKAVQDLTAAPVASGE